MAILDSRTPVPVKSRQAASLALSAIAHVVTAVVVGVLAFEVGMPAMVRHPAPTINFVNVFMPPPVPASPSAPLRLRNVPRPEPDASAAPAIVPEPAAAPERTPAATPAPEARRESAAATERRPAKAEVTVGAFDVMGESPRATETSRAVRAGGFDTEVARGPEVRIAPTAVGTFASGAAGPPRVGTDRPNVVGDAGFGSAVATGPARSGTAKGVADAGFGAVASGNGGGGRGDRAGRGVAASGIFDVPREVAARPSPPPRATQTTPFDAPVERTAVAEPTRRTPTTVALEILSKPTPVYTQEARELKIEGEVVLEVEFAASGQVHVLAVIRGLGHGLDEAARRAVESMRFKPALRDGLPVDVRTSVNIVFRLA